jgi:hypothetical protein
MSVHFLTGGKVSNQKLILEKNAKTWLEKPQHKTLTLTTELQVRNSHNELCARDGGRTHDQGLSPASQLYYNCEINIIKLYNIVLVRRKQYTYRAMFYLRGR